ncbi:MAG TPA: glutaredoxin family protein [Chthoniobacterales bacterium]
MTPTLYVKTGCPYCKAAIDYLDNNGIAFNKVDVREQPAKMQELQDVSGQTKTPTLDWDGDVLADFGVEDLEEFLADRANT